MWTHIIRDREVRVWSVGKSTRERDYWRKTPTGVF